MHWITFFDEKVVDENSQPYRSTDPFDWGKWHREQGVLVPSLATYGKGLFCIWHILYSLIMEELSTCFEIVTLPNWGPAVL